MGTTLGDIDAFLASVRPSPTPTPSPRPASLSTIDAFLAQHAAPAPSPSANPLDNLFAPPSPSPLAPPVGPDVVDVPGEDSNADVPVWKRVQRVLQSIPGILPSAFDGTPAPTEQPYQGVEALGAAYRGLQGAIGLPAQAVDAASQRVTGRPAGDVLGEAVGRAIGAPPERVQEGVKATERVAAAHPSVPGLGIAARAAGVGAAMTDEATKVAGRLGADPSMYLLPASKALQAFFVPGMVEGAGKEFAEARALYEAAGSKVTPDVARAVVRAVASTAFATTGALHMARDTAGGPVTRESVETAVERARATEPPRPAVEPPSPVVTEPPAPPAAPAAGTAPTPPAPAPGGPTTTTTAAPKKPVHPDLDLLTQAAEALAQPSGRTSSLIRDGLGNVIGRTGNTAHPAKVELGLTEFTEGPARLAAALRRLAEGKESPLGERVLAQMKAYGAAARMEMEAKRIAENSEAGRASFDPDALELPPIEGASHGEGNDYRDVVLSAANTHLGPVEGRGVVSGDAPTGQRWYGFKDEDGSVSAALGISTEGLVTDWAGTGPGTGLVVRRAAKENPDLRIDFDSLSDESAPLLNRVMNSGGKWGEAVRVQYEAHLRERGLHPEQAEGGGTVPPGGTDGPSAAGGPDSGGGRGGGAGGGPPPPVVEPGGEGAPREGQGGGGSGQPPNRPPTAEVTPEPTPPVDPVTKLLNLIKQAPSAIKETEGLRMSERIRRSQELSRITSTVRGREALQQSRAALKGELPQADFDPVGKKLTEDDVNALLNRVWDAPIQPFERHRAAEALTNIMEGGRIPQQNEIALLERIFGEDLADALLNKRGGWHKARDIMVDAANLPRAIVSSFDMSAPLRQGLLLTVGRPRQAAGAAKHMVKAAFSQETFNAVEASIRNRPNAELYDSTGLYLAGNTRAAGLNAREENFMSRFAERIPLIGRAVRGSERAYIGYLNKLRADVFDAVAAEWLKGGVDPTKAPSRYQGLAEYINMATGRGHLGKLERIAPLMNAAFFSPRFMMARIQALNPVTYARMEPAVRREAARNMVSTLGAGLAVISMAKMAGADVEVDPRSSDFGKIRVGRTRMDVWGGFQQPIRYLFQIITGQRKPEQGGIQAQRDRTVPVGRFLRSKEAPLVSTAHDLAAGKDFIGADVTLENEAKELFSPMFLMDFMEAVQEHGFVLGGAMAAPAFFGVGVTTHQPRNGETARPR